MSSFKIALFALATIALASAAVNPSYTCVGNPYFTAPYNPNPVTLAEPTKQQLDGWSATYDTTTKVYDLSNYKDLSFCQELATTGSCCSPDVLNENVKNFGELVKATGNATVKLFDKRVGALKNYGKAYGKIISSFVNLFAKIHGTVLKVLVNLPKIAGDMTNIIQLAGLAEKYNVTQSLTDLMGNKTTEQKMAEINAQNVTSFMFEALSLVTGPAGISQSDLAEIFDSLKSFAEISMGASDNVMKNFNPFGDVDPGFISSATDALGNIFGEISSRTVNLTIDLGLTPMGRRMLSQIVVGDPTKSAQAPTESGGLTIPFPLLLDARNIETVAKAISKGIGNAKTANETFLNIYHNNQTIYKAINDSWVSDIKSLKDVKAGGDWGQVRSLVISLAKLSFDDSLHKVVAVAEHKKKCLNVLFKYQGFIGCLACDASALVTKKVILNATAGTFSPVISSKFGKEINANCYEYLNDLVFMKGFMTVSSLLDASKKNEDKAKKNPKDVDTKINTNVTKDSFDINCSVIDANCNWIQRKVIDNLGVSPSVLCDFSGSDDCDALDTLKGLRTPFVNKGKNPNKRILADASGSGEVVYSDDSTAPDVSSTKVGFATESNYTVDTNATANVTVDSTQENNTDNSSNSTSTNTSNSTNSTGKFGLKALVSIPLVLATIFAFFF